MITSLANQKIKNVIQLLGKSKQRKQQGVFVVEGTKMALEAPLEKVKEVYVSESFWMKKENQSLASHFPKNKVEIVTDEVFRKMSDTIAPQGILCVVDQMDYALLDLLEKKEATFLVLEDIQDPGNLGTMIRSAEGAGIDAVLMSKGTVDIYNPKTIRSTMGSIYRVPFCYVEDLEKLLHNLNEREFVTYAAHLDAKKAYDKVKYPKKTAFLIGNEGNGLSEEITGLSKEKIIIPMEGKVESLNAAISATLLMYEIYRQRRNE